jgi:NADP-dependent 3-hydroxy acid dehydrogenase YdfG
MSAAADKPVLLITGGSSGVGAATARLAVESGYRVALLARSAEKLELVVAECGPERALPVVCDVRDWDQQQAAAAATLDAFGRLDAAFVNAGFGGRGEFLDDSPERWREILDVTLYGAALTIRACLPALEAADSGHLVICGSTAARTYEFPTMYSAAKWGLTALGHGLRAKLAPRGVRVTLVEPGLIDTPFLETVGTSLEEIQGLTGIEQPLAAEDVAGAVLYALGQPPHVAVNEILLRPSSQIH